MGSVIVASNVGKKFRRYHADRPATIQEAVAKGLRRHGTTEYFWGLRDVSFEVPSGRTVGIVGSNGSGKSTLLRLIGGVGRPDTGSIDVHGRIGALLDLSAGFHPDLTGRENAVLAGILNGLTRRQVLQRLDAIVAFAEVEEALDNPIRTYSSGMQMRLAFSVAVHTEPEVLLIDEVLAVGDIAFQRKCLDRILQFKAAGCSILLVSHIDGAITHLCDEAIWLHAGELMAQGPAPEIVARYSGAMVEGTPAPTDVDEAEMPSDNGFLIKTPTGTRLQITVERFGTMDLKFEDIRIVNDCGESVTEIESGRPVTIEMDYVVPSATVNPIFCAGILLENGTICYFTHSEASFKQTITKAAGRASITFDRIDLNAGRYLVAVACYARGWRQAYDFQPTARTITVKASGPAEPLMVTPHTWKVQVDGKPD